MHKEVKKFLTVCCMFFIPLGLFWFFIVKSPTTINSAISYRNNNDCINAAKGYLIYKNCILADDIIEKYYFELSKDLVINKIILKLTKENIQCDILGSDTNPLCIAIGIRLSEIDQYKIAQPNDIVNSITYFNNKNQNELAINASQSLLANNTKIAESILVNFKSNY